MLFLYCSAPLGSEREFGEIVTKIKGSKQPVASIVNLELLTGIILFLSLWENHLTTGKHIIWFIIEGLSVLNVGFYFVFYK